MKATIKVYDKRFAGELMIINEDDYDASVHRREADGPWPVEAIDINPPDATSDLDTDKGKKKK